MTFRTLARADAAFPPLLAELYDPPSCLFLRGERAELLAGPAVAVVGARSCYSYGAHVARALARELAAAGAGRDGSAVVLATGSIYLVADLMRPPGAGRGSTL